MISLCQLPRFIFQLLPFNETHKSKLPKRYTPSNKCTWSNVPALFSPLQLQPEPERDSGGNHTVKLVNIYCNLW